MMPEANAENLTEIAEEYSKSLVEIIITLEKIQEKICNICPKRKICDVEMFNKKIRHQLKQSNNIPDLAKLVGILADYISKEIFLQTVTAMQKRAKKETKINIE